jgi:hypothetical protein
MMPHPLNLEATCPFCGLRDRIGLLLNEDGLCKNVGACGVRMTVKAAEKRKQETGEVIAILGEYRPQCEADTCYNGNRDLPAGWEPPYIHPVCKGDRKK